jgi:hypothetical protein
LRVQSTHKISALNEKGTSGMLPYVISMQIP